MTAPTGRPIWRRELNLEYRWRCGKRCGRWHDSYQGVGDAAVREGLAGWSGRTLYTGPMVSIESRPIARAAGNKKAGQA